MVMRYKIFLCLTSISMIPATFGADAGAAPKKPDIYAKDARSQALKAQKKAVDKATQKRLKARATGRTIQDSSQSVINLNDKLYDVLFHLPLVIRMEHSVAAVAVLNQVVRAVSVGVRAFGRREQALRAIGSTDEQILEAAVQSYEKISVLSKKIEDLVGQKTIAGALKKVSKSTLEQGKKIGGLISKKMTGNDIKEASLSAVEVSKKILDLFSPYRYINTFDNFTDDLHLTDNKAERWEIIKQMSKDLKEEQNRFDDYIALMQIKLLERMIATYHITENKDKHIQNLQAENGSLDALKKAIKITDDKINAIKNQQPKGSIFNRLKKTVGRDVETINAKTIASLEVERGKYIQQKEDIENQIKQYGEMTIDPSTIKTEKAELEQKIKDIQIERANRSPENLADKVTALEKQIESIQEELKNLRAPG